MNAYKDLNAPELVTWFAKITHGYIHKGRDAQMLSHFMAIHGVTPIKMLDGFILFSMMPDTKDVPTLIRCISNWLEEDELIAAASVTKFLTQEEYPPCYWKYRDLRDWDAADAVVESHYTKAKEELSDWCDNALSKPATIRAGSRPPRKYQLPRSPEQSTG